MLLIQRQCVCPWLISTFTCCIFIPKDSGKAVGNTACNDDDDDDDEGEAADMQGEFLNNLKYFCQSWYIY